jgi:hypothetical protein
LVLAIGLVSFGINAYKSSGITERMTTALTIGDHKLSSAELSYYYFDAINSTYQEWYNTYGDYTSTYLSMLYGLDLSKPLVAVSGSLEESAIRRIDHTSLEGNYLNLLQQDINELRETSGNTETSTGSVSSGVTAASAIAALQEASGKGSRDSTRASYRAFAQIAELCVELIRQFYSLPRQFRIAGQEGSWQYIRYTNAGLQPQQQMLLGQPMGMRKPVFDIRISAQRKNPFSTVSQNELAMQLFRLGLLNPQLADQAALCLELMDFEGKDALAQKVARSGSLYRKLLQYMTLALGLARNRDPALAEMISGDLTALRGRAPGSAGKGIRADALPGREKQEPGHVARARQQAADAVQPRGEVNR